MGALTALLFMAPRLRGYRLVAQSPASITRMALGKTKFAGGKTKHTRRASARELLIQSLHCALRPSSLYGLRRSTAFVALRPSSLSSLLARWSESVPRSARCEESLRTADDVASCGRKLRSSILSLPSESRSDLCASQESQK